MKRFTAIILAAALLLMCGCTTPKELGDKALEALEAGDIDTAAEYLAKLNDTGDTDEMTSVLGIMTDLALPILAKPDTYAFGISVLEAAGKYTDLSHLLENKTSPISGVSNWAYFWGNYIADNLNGAAFSSAVKLALTTCAPECSDMASLRTATEALLDDEFNREMLDGLMAAALTEADRAYLTAVNTYYSLACETVFGATDLGELGLWMDVWFSTMISVLNDGISLDNAILYTYTVITSDSMTADDINAGVLDLLRSCCFLSFER